MHCNASLHSSQNVLRALLPGRKSRHISRSVHLSATPWLLTPAHLLVLKHSSALQSHNQKPFRSFPQTSYQNLVTHNFQHTPTKCPPTRQQRRVKSARQSCSKASEPKQSNKLSILTLTNPTDQRISPSPNPQERLCPKNTYQTLSHTVSKPVTNVNPTSQQSQPHSPKIAPLVPPPR